MICFIGIGKAGTQLANLAHEDNPNSELVTFDEKDASYIIPRFSTPEEYESKVKLPRTLTKAKEVVVFLSGSGDTTFITLRVLQKVSKKKISVIYVRPFLKNLSETAKKKEKVIFGVLTHFALSAKFKLYLYDSQKITDYVGSAPVLTLYSKVNKYIVWSYTAYRALLSSEKIISYYEDPPEYAWILTIDLKQPESSEPVESFDFKNPRGCNLLCVVPEKTLQEDETLLPSIETEKHSYETDITRSTYSIIKTENQEMYTIIEKFTNYPQYTNT